MASDSEGEGRPTSWPGYFFPPLAQQRRTFCLDVLKREDIRSVCELGCGEGDVLTPMVNGASHSDAFPEVYVEEPELESELESIPSSSNSSSIYEDSSIEEAPAGEGGHSDGRADDDDDEEEEAGGGGPSATKTRRPKINRDILEKFKLLPKLRPQDKELHLRRIAGLDISPEALQEAVYQTSPSPYEMEQQEAAAEHSNGGGSHFFHAPLERDRWEDLRIELWQGSLDIYNEAFDNFDSFILTEVIEHLSDKSLFKFPDVLFGSYRPRIVVVTTPNYDFNRYFRAGEHSDSPAAGVDADTDPSPAPTKPGRGSGKTAKEASSEVDAEARHAFPDPTGRTERVFRDADHKFEWTQTEFKQWCDSITSKYDYTVTITGVGSLRNYFGKGGFHTLDQSGQGPLSVGPSAVATPQEPPERIQTLLASCPGGDPSQFFATQAAVFRRKFAYESERSPRSPAQVPLAFYGAGKRPSPVTGRGGVHLPEHADIAPAPSFVAPSGSGTEATTSPGQHKLIKTHFYKAAKDAGNPKSLEEIRSVLDELMRGRMLLRSCTIRELWGRHEVARACGGYIMKIIEAVIRDPAQAWDIDFRPETLLTGAQMEDAVSLVLKDFEEPEIPWDDPEELTSRKPKRPKWVERDLDLEQDIKGMRVDDEDDFANEPTWGDSQHGGSDFGQDETWRAWDEPDEGAGASGGLASVAEQDDNAWGDSESPAQQQVLQEQGEAARNEAWS